MSAKTEPKFQVGQIAVLKHSKKTLPFVILEAVWNDGWFYKWNKRNAASEHMVRGLTPEEVGKSVCENCDDLTHLFELQNTRMDKATKLWRDATGKHDTLPDLGSLLDWLMETRTMISPEPREPAAREAATRIATLVTASHEGCKTIGILRCNIERLGTEVIEAYSAELRAAHTAQVNKWDESFRSVENSAKVFKARAEAAEASLKDQTFWADQYHKAAIAAEASLLQAQQERDDLRSRANFEDGVCFTCKKSTSGLAGNPSLWPLWLTYYGGNGKWRCYHYGCVTAAVAALASTSAPEGTV